GLFCEICLIFFRKMTCNVSEGFIYGSFIDMQLHQARFKVQWQGSLVANGLFKRVAAHIALLIFGSSKGPEGIAIAFVDGRTSKAEQKCMRQSLAHLFTQIALLCAVCFIYHQDNVTACIENTGSLSKFVNSGDDDFASILCQ